MSTKGAIPGKIRVELLSGTTFGRGEGTPGVVDVEVEQESSGLPMLGGKAVRGLLRDSWLSMQVHFGDLWEAAHRVFGATADTEEKAVLRIGDALIESRTRSYLLAALERDTAPIPAATLLEGLTEIRSQTAVERATGAPARATLRASRVLVRGLAFEAPLTWLEPPTAQDRACLALATLATRHAGMVRNRGRGHVAITLDGDLETTRRFVRSLA